MYDDRLIMYVKNPAVSVYGWGLYYWFVKLRHDATDEARGKLHDWYHNKDDICTGFAGHGDFDFFNGDHMRVLDNLLADVIDPWKANPEIDWVHLAPIRRDVRESHVNMWDAPDDGYAECVWGEGQLEKLAAHTDKVDLVDLKIVEALNTKRPMADFYDFDVLAEIEEILQADLTWQFRRWVARLDDQNGFWEECLFTDEVDLVFVAVPAHLVKKVLEDAVAKKAKMAVIATSAFKEIGRGELQDELTQYCRDNELPLVGPNLVGMGSPHLHFNCGSPARASSGRPLGRNISTSRWRSA